MVSTPGNGGLDYRPDVWDQGVWAGVSGAPGGQMSTESSHPCVCVDPWVVPHIAFCHPCVCRCPCCAPHPSNTSVYLCGSPGCAPTDLGHFITCHGSPLPGSLPGLAPLPYSLPSSLWVQVKGWPRLPTIEACSSSWVEYVPAKTESLIKEAPNKALPRSDCEPALSFSNLSGCEGFRGAGAGLLCPG